MSLARRGQIGWWAAGTLAVTMALLLISCGDDPTAGGGDGDATGAKGTGASGGEAGGSGGDEAGGSGGNGTGGSGGDEAGGDGGSDGSAGAGGDDSAGGEGGGSSPPQAAVFGGVYAENVTCGCVNENELTGDCSCAGAFDSVALNGMNDCPATDHKSVIHFCSAEHYSPTSDFAGVYQIDDLGAACSADCFRPNPYTHGCSCPPDTEPIVIRSLSEEVYLQCILGSHIVICANTNAEITSFGGAYQVDDPVTGGQGCRTTNPRTGDCSCPTGTTASAIRLIVDPATGRIGSNLYVCVK